MPMAISRNGYLKTPKKRPKTTKNIEKRLQTSETAKTPKIVNFLFSQIVNFLFSWGPDRQFFFFRRGRRASGEAAARPRPVR